MLAPRWAARRGKIRWRNNHLSMAWLDLRDRRRERGEWAGHLLATLFRGAPARGKDRSARAARDGGESVLIRTPPRKPQVPNPREAPIFKLQEAFTEAQRLDIGACSFLGVW